MYDDILVGSCGIKIDQHNTHICSLGFFVDENYWGKGIATYVVPLLEHICFEELGIKRIEIRMYVENKVSEKVAIKCGYTQ